MPLTDPTPRLGTLTETQTQVLSVLRTRGADWSASAAEDNWRTGRAAFFDDRNAATRGLIRLIRKANREATQRA